MKFDLNCIDKLANILKEKGLTELTIGDGNKSLTLKNEIVQNMAVPSQIAAQAPISSPSAQKTGSKKDEVEKIPKITKRAITSPMVGTFYQAPSPGAASFVELGNMVNKGQVVCIIEAMKLMNEIESEVSGKVVEICVKDGDAIEFGQTLMYVE